MARLCEGRIVAITGAGRGIGRAHALAFAEHGAKVVVNDLGAALDGDGASAGPAHDVVTEILAAGGEAVANTDDCADWDGGRRLVETAVDSFGRLDVLVTNAGILRDKMLVSMGEDDWDAVMRVHLRGTFCAAHHAAVYWREQSKSGQPVDARLITTSSAAGLYGNVGQTNYSAAKAGIAAFTITAAAELGRYGVTCNALAPAARTRMTEALFGEIMKVPEEGFDAMAPENNSPIVVWLGSAKSTGVTGRVFEAMGGRLGVAEGFRHGPSVAQDHAFDPALLGPIVAKLLSDATEPTALLGAS